MKKRFIITADVILDEEIFEDEKKYNDYLTEHGITGIIAHTPFESRMYEEFTTYEEEAEAYDRHLKEVYEHFEEMKLIARDLELALLANGYDLSQLLSGTSWTEEEIRHWFPSTNFSEESPTSISGGRNRYFITNYIVFL